MLKTQWEQLSPKVKRIIIIAGILGGLALVMTFFSSDKESDPRSRSRDEVVRHVLTDRDTRNVSLDALSAELKTLRAEHSNVLRELDKANKDLESIKANENITPKIEKELQALQSKISQLEQEQRDFITQTPSKKDELGEEGETDELSHLTIQPDQGPVENEPKGLQIDPANPNAIFERTSWPTTVVANPTPTSAGAYSGEASAPSFQIMVYQQANDETESEEEIKEESIFLPAGSILTGVFLNGLDAPTGQGARRDPFPATLRIQKEAILPNRFRADVRECFLIVAGYGDLSSERAYLRGETISCVREDGGVIESSLDSYAVGEDGKAGVRGRLVSKQGQIIAKSLMAGFMSGVSKAFDVQPIPIIDTSGNSRNYQRNTINSDWLQSAAVNGAGSALDRVAEFYMDMAEGMFPVIEIDAGRQIDIIMSRGTSLQLKTKR